MAKIAEAYVELFARMDRLKKGMARAGNLVRKGMAKMTVAVKAFAAATRTAMRHARMALLAFAGAVAGVLYLTAQQEKAEAKLAAVMRATGHAAGFTTEQMLKMASAMQHLIAVGDEEIINAQALMSTFLNIGGKVFIDAMEAAANLSRVFDQDLRQSVLQLGIALNDPVLGYTRLRRVGVNFSAVQVQQIKNFAALGDIVSAQRVILKELETEVGGVARAYGESLAGRLALVKGLLGDLVQAFGKAVTAGLPWENLLGRITKATQWMEANGETVKEIVWAIGKAMLAVGTAVGKVFLTIITAIYDLITALSELRGMSKGMGPGEMNVAGLPVGGVQAEIDHYRQYMNEEDAQRAGRKQWGKRMERRLEMVNQRQAAPIGKEVGGLKDALQDLTDTAGDFYFLWEQSQREVIDDLYGMAKAGNEAAGKQAALAAAFKEVQKSLPGFQERGAGIIGKFFESMGRGDIAKKLSIRKELNDQLKALTEFEDKLIAANMMTVQWRGELVFLRKALHDTAAAERSVIEQQRQANTRAVAAGFAQRIGGIGPIKLDAGFSASSIKNVASENTARESLMVQQQIRDAILASTSIEGITLVD